MVRWSRRAVLLTFYFLLFTFFAGRTFTLREQGEAYTSGFADKNAVLRLDNNCFYGEKTEIEGTQPGPTLGYRDKVIWLPAGKSIQPQTCGPSFRGELAGFVCLDDGTVYSHRTDATQKPPRQARLVGVRIGCSRSGLLLPPDLVSGYRGGNSRDQCRCLAVESGERQPIGSSVGGHRIWRSRRQVSDDGRRLPFTRRKRKTRQGWMAAHQDRGHDGSERTFLHPVENYRLTEGGRPAFPVADCGGVFRPLVGDNP